MKILTYSDLQACGDDEEKRKSFVLDAISEHKTSDEYKTALTAHEYYKKHNPDIARLEKVIYDMKGMAHKDLVSPNHKLRNGYYPSAVNQTVSHLLANGVGFSDPEIKKRLGRNFDGVLRKIAVDAKNSGVSYGFYNGEKVIHFPFLEFKAIPDDRTGAIVAGVRFTQIDSNKPLVATLYEPDGYTEYTRYKNDLEITKPKTVYIVNNVSNDVEGVYAVHEGNFSRLPIYPLYNVSHQSEIIGTQEILTAIDMVNSQLVNNVSQGELVYWVLKNYGGMDDIDDSNFMVNLLKNHIIHVDSDGDASPHQIETPFEANETAASRLKRLFYDSIGAVDTETLKAGNLTATAINAAYHDMRLNSANMEYEVIEFIQGILRIAGLSEDVVLSFTYFETVNETEAIQNIIASSSYIGDETSTRKICEILGITDDFENIQKNKSAESLRNFSDGYGGNNNEKQ